MTLAVVCWLPVLVSEQGYGACVFRPYPVVQMAPCGAIVSVYSLPTVTGGLPVIGVQNSVLVQARPQEKVCTAAVKPFCLHNSVEQFLKGSWNAIER